MSQNRDYGWYRKTYQDVSMTAIFAAATDDTTLITAKTAHTIFVQRIVVYILTDFAASTSFEDSTAVTPVRAANIPASPGVDTRWDFDFTERGKPLTEAKNLVANVSAAGLAMHIEVMAYMKPTSAYAAF